MGRDQTEKLPCRTSARGWKRESELYSMADGGKRAENGGRKGGREENKKKRGNRSSRFFK